MLCKKFRIFVNNLHETKKENRSECVKQCQIPPPQPNTINRGAIQYELTNHLGNVMAVVTGKKLRDADYNYLPDLVSTQDYSPFGMQIEGRSWNSKEYRFGFQGQETENDM